MLEHFKIIGLNELNEPFNSTDILNTPQYVNKNEPVFFFYASTTGLTLKGDERWEWNFDDNQIIPDQPIQSIYGFEEPLSVIFTRKGNRDISLKVYEQIQKRSVKLSVENSLDVGDEPISFINNIKTGNLLVLNRNDSSITIINSIDQIINTINLADNPILASYNPISENFYITTDNSNIVVIDANTETITTNINSSFIGELSSIENISGTNFVYTSTIRIGQDKIDVINTLTNTIISTIDVNESPKSLKYSNKFSKLYVANSGSDEISIIDINTNTVENVISTNTSTPYHIELDEVNDYLYIRTEENVEIFDINSTSFINSFYVGELTFLNENTTNILQVNTNLNEVYALSSTSSVEQYIKTIDLFDFSFNDNKEVKKSGIINSIYYDPITLALNYTINDGIVNKFTSVETPTFDNYYEINTDYKTINIFKGLNNKLYSTQPFADKILIQDIFTNETNLTVDGQVIYNDTNSFYVFEFPSIIEGLEYAVDNQLLTYTTNSDINAQSYEWFINGVKQLSTINSISFQFINVVKVLITVNVLNGRTIKQLNFTVKLSQGSAVIGKKYEGNVTDNLLFFNKEGDNLNFELVEGEDGLPYWEGDMIFHVNSSDTFKTIGLYTLEKVEPLKFKTEDLYLRKLQMFNQYGIDFQSSVNNSNVFEIDSIESVNNQSDYYTKWLYCPNIQNSVPIGSEIILSDFYEVTVDTTIPTNPILTNFEIIEELDSNSTSGGTDLFTVVGNKRNAIMVISKTNNNNFNKNYGYGEYRLQNNSIQNVPKGKIEVKNIIKVYDSHLFNFDWNEPFYKDLFYDRKKITLLNTQKNDGIYTINYIDNDISKDLNNKILKIDSIKIDDLLVSPELSFQIKIKFKTTKILLSSGIPVDFLPRASDSFLNQRNILVWESVLNKDFTPPLLKANMGFSFENVSPSENNFNQIYKSKKIGFAGDILTPQTTDESDFKLILNNFDLLDGYTFKFKVNNTLFSITEGNEWFKGSSITDSAISIAKYLDNENNINGLSVIGIDGEVWIHTKTNYELFLITKDNNENELFINDNYTSNIFNLEKGVLKENNPLYGIVGDVWSYMDDSTYNGYIHHRISQGNFHILYYVSGSPIWYTLPLNKKVVWAEPTTDIDYKENLISNSYLENNELIFTQIGDSKDNVTSEMIIERFIGEYSNTLFGYGLDVFNDNNEYLSIARTMNLKDINPINDYIEVEYLVDSNGMLGTNGAILGTSGTSFIIEDYVSSTSSFVIYQTVENFETIEELKTEKNRIFGKNNKPNSISNIFERRIIVKDIDKSFGFVMTINGINYNVTADNVSFSGVSSVDDSILDVEETLTDWGNQKFQLDQDITPDDDSDIGKPYYKILEEQGILVWLDKSEESLVQNVSHFDTIVIQSRFPNINITYDINGTLDQHKIIHSDIEFYEIGSSLTVTINRYPYSIENQGSISSTLEEWVNLWETTLLEQDIIVDYYQPLQYTESTSFNVDVYDNSGTNFLYTYSTSGLIDLNNGTDFYGGSIYDRLRFSTIEEKTNFSYNIWIGKNNQLGNTFYNIIDYRKGNTGILISGNEIRINTIDFQDVGFATGMITSLSGSKFPMNNQEYNFIFVDPNIIGLSYQGAFWNNNDLLNYSYQRSGFEWELYNEFTYEENSLNGVYSSTAGTSSILVQNSPYYLEYDPINDYMWLSHINSLSNIVEIFDTSNNTLIKTLNLGSDIKFIKYNQVNRRMYVSNTGSNTVSVINSDNFNIIKTVLTDISPNHSEVDIFTGYLYVVCSGNDSVNIIDGITSNVLKTILVGNNPTKIVFDYNNRNMYVLNNNDETVSIISTNTNSVIQNVNVGGSPSDIIYNDIDNKIYVSNSTSSNLTVINTTTYLPNFIELNSNPLQLSYSKVDNYLFIATDSQLVVIKNESIKFEIELPIGIIPSYIKYIPFSRSIFITSESTNQIAVFKIDDDGFVNLEEILNSGINPLFINWSSNKQVYVSNINDNIINTYQQINFTTEVISNTSGLIPLSLSSREFLRYPRERFDGNDPIQFRMSWEDTDIENKNTDIFFYDFSGEQIYIEQRNNKGIMSRINDKGIYNYTGNIPLLDSDDIGYLKSTYNKDLKELKTPSKQQTVWDEMYYNLFLVDSETEIDFNPYPLQTFIGYNSKEEGVDSRTMLIERLENISLTIKTHLLDEKDPTKGWLDILDFDEKLNQIVIKNSKINFIESGFQIGQKIEIKGRDIISKNNQATFKNSGFIGIIESVLVNKMTLRPLNKSMKTESSLTTTRSVIPPFRIKEAAFEILITVLPTNVAKINIKGQTEIEDERFKVSLDNKGYNINHRDVYIFDDYDIKENGIDWVYLNEKRKEMLTMYPEIYNYLGSYKALVNAINYFGYEDIELYEYYLNIDKQSRFHNKLYKIEIPDIFNNQVEGYTPNDFIIKTLPNNRYQKTKLFNLTYRITDLDGNNILAFSLDEVITKLLGLKKWLREHIMPVGTRIRDLTGRGDTPHTIKIWHDLKFSTKFEIKEDLTVVDFKLEAYQQPVDNHSKTYNMHLEFKTNNDNIPSYYQVNIKTFSANPNIDTKNFKLNQVQNHSYYKTDLKHINFTADRLLDPFIMIETIQDNGYGATYSNKKTFTISPNGLDIISL